MSFHRRLRFEPLEDRLALSITVTTLNDEDNGMGQLNPTSLREAIAAATPGETINFSVTGSINLTSLGHLVIDKDVSIIGPGAELLTIHAFNPTRISATVVASFGSTTGRQRFATCRFLV
jgi:hypothetical protein